MSDKDIAMWLVFSALEIAVLYRIMMSGFGKNGNLKEKHVSQLSKEFSEWMSRKVISTPKDGYVICIQGQHDFLSVEAKGIVYKTEMAAESDMKALQKVNKSIKLEVRKIYYGYVYE